MKLGLITVAAGLSLAACTMNDEGAMTPPSDGMAGASSATARLRTAAGADVGTVTATEMNRSLRVQVDARMMPPGPHGVHVHMVGRCDGPDFTTAGGHWNPTNRQHGSQNPAGPHVGDMPNLLIGTDGSGSLSITLPGGTLAGLMDGDGSAFVVHASADDLRTDPAGNSGGRIACGVFERT